MSMQRTSLQLQFMNHAFKFPMSVTGSRLRSHAYPLYKKLIPDKMDDVDGEFSVVHCTALNDSSLEKFDNDSGASPEWEAVKQADDKGSSNSCNQIDAGNEKGVQRHHKERQFAPKDEASDGHIDDAHIAANAPHTETNVFAAY